MCPDRQILSVYFDGELGSPWKEKLEKHLEDCVRCREQLESYRLARRELSPAADALSRGALDRVWEKLAFAKTRRPRKKFWTGYVTIPNPVAAAAGFIMVLALAVLIMSKQPVKVNEAPLAGLEVQDMMPVSDMASLLQYLGSENSPDMVIIHLPNTTFTNAGEPTMLRAADYTRGSSQ
jgi:hypothetical protein